MKQKLTAREYISVASMLFGLFFGAGNLIFPVHMGQLAGSNFWPAILGFLVTGVGLPLLAVAALGISRSSGLYDLGSKISKPYSMFFTCALYLTIGPFFAIPRCAATSFTVGLEQILPAGHARLYLLLFSLIFFVAALWFSLFPGNILTWVGKILNPCFLLFLGILVVVVVMAPSAAISSVQPMGDYATQPFFAGFLDGYNTMDILAGLAFGIVVVRVIQGLGVEDSDAVAANTVRAGVFGCLLMGFIYLAVTVVGVQSRGLFEVSENGGIALAQIARHYLGYPGLFILAATVTLACLKTSVGLITSCGEAFTDLFPNGPSYRTWAVIFSVGSFLIANLGLDLVIAFSLPVLMFLYPLAIALIFLALTARFYGHDRTVGLWTIALTLVGAIYDLVRSLPTALLSLLHLDGAVATLTEVLPFAKLGLFWLCPAALGFLIGLVFHVMNKKKTA